MAELKTTEQSIRDIISYALDNANTVIPATVQSYDPATQTAEVRVTIVDNYAVDGSTAPRVKRFPVLPGVPVVFPRGGGWSITWPLKRGDNVVLVFSQRSIAEWFNTDGTVEVSPRELKAHGISGAFAIPGPPTKSTKLASDAVSGDDLILRHSDGTELQLGKDKTVSLTANRLNIGSESASTAIAKGQVTEDHINAIKARVDTLSAILSLPPVVLIGSVKSGKAFTND